MPAPRRAPYPVWKATDRSINTRSISSTLQVTRTLPKIPTAPSQPSIASSSSSTAPRASRHRHASLWRSAACATPPSSSSSTRWTAKARIPSTSSTKWRRSSRSPAVHSPGPSTSANASRVSITSSNRHSTSIHPASRPSRRALPSKALTTRCSTNASANAMPRSCAKTSNCSAVSIPTSTRRLTSTDNWHPSSSVRHSTTSVCANCLTASARLLPPPSQPRRWSASCSLKSRNSQASCSRSMPTWTPTTVRASPSSRSAQASSNAASITSTYALDRRCAFRRLPASWHRRRKLSMNAGQATS